MSPLNCRCTQLYDLEAAIRLAFGMVSQRPQAVIHERLLWGISSRGYSASTQQL